MLLGSLPRPVASQLGDLLKTINCERIFVCGSGPFRLERAILTFAPQAQLFSSDSSLYATAIGRWLSDQDPGYRFTGPLEPLEALLDGASPARRAAGIMAAMELAPHAKGKVNAYKQAHLDHLLSRLDEVLGRAEEKLAKAFGGVKLAGYRAGGWLEQIDRAIGERATIATLRVSTTERLDGLLKWVGQNAEWDRPAAPAYDPKTLQATVDRIIASGVDYLVITDHELERPAPRAKYQGAGNTDHFCYVSAPAARLTRAKTGGTPFNYTPLDLSKLTAKSKVELQRVDGGRAMYIRSIYLKKSITPVPGVHNYLVYVGGMLAGVMVYAPSKFTVRPDDIYLLSDVSVSREAKVSKLIARLASNATIMRDMSARSLRETRYVITTAFSDHPVSMKYRGVFDLLTRKEAADGHGFQLQYGAEARDESPQDAFAWWWSTYVEPKPAAAGRGGRR